MVEIRLKTGNATKDISILNTYAPHNGYPVEIINRYWEDINAYTSLLPQNLIKIWCTDNNGQLSNNDTNTQNIGKWTVGKLWKTLIAIR